MIVHQTLHRRQTVRRRGKAGAVETVVIVHCALRDIEMCIRDSFPDELTSEIFEHILNKALNNRMLDTSAIFIDGTHISDLCGSLYLQRD